jgi:CheY-like chemotaxis protein
MPAPSRAPPDEVLGRPNSLGLTEKQLNQVLDEIERSDPGSRAMRRDFVRWPFRQIAVSVQVHVRGGPVTPLRLACRNLSRGGICLLHSAYMHPGTRVTAFLPHPTRGTVPLAGAVVRCAHRTAMIHEVGVKFDAPIDVRDFIVHDPFSDCFSLERVAPEDLVGTVVLVDDSEMNQRLLRHYLRGTQIRLRTAATIDDGLTLVSEGCDLVIVDFHLESTRGTDLLVAMRQRGLTVPSIMITCDSGAATRDELAQCGAQASALLAQPLSQDLFLRAVAEFLVVHRTADSVYSTLSPDDPAAPLVVSFLQDVRAHVRELQEAIRRGDAQRCRRICLQIMGTAPSLGFAGLARLAGVAADALARERGVEGATQPMLALVSACQNARAQR